MSFFRSRAALSILAINRDRKTLVFFSLSKFVFTVWTSGKGRCDESLWTFNFLFGLLRIANCAWFCLIRFCRGVNKGQFIV